jgi:type IV secretory pathway ATPase VirB11/archaellum biosynthesis ATPase
MRSDLGREPWDRPYHWWGPPWVAPNPLTLADLVGKGTLNHGQAAWLADQVRNGGSVIVAALHSGTGKSTLAHALINQLPPERTLVYLRGQAETFTWTERQPPESTTILVNEMSDHLPVYCWGPCARVVLRLAVAGYQVIATIHADTPGALFSLLRSPGIGASDAEIVALNIVVFLDITPGGERTVAGIVRLTIDPETRQVEARPVDIQV